MARMKVCPVCGHRNAAGKLECELDQVPLADVPLTDEEAASRQKEGSASEPVLTPDREMREECRSRACVTLEFPWGEVQVRDRLNVGRDPEFSQLAHMIADNEYVSRRHAEVFVQQGILYIRHLGRTNPTYHNGKQIEAEEIVELADGDEISFSKYLKAKVRLDHI